MSEPSDPILSEGQDLLESFTTDRPLESFDYEIFTLHPGAESDFLTALQDLHYAAEAASPAPYADSLSDICSAQLEHLDDCQLLDADGVRPLDIYRHPERDTISSIVKADLIVSHIQAGRGYPHAAESTSVQRAFVSGICTPDVVERLVEGMKLEPYIVIEGPAASDAHFQVLVSDIYDRIWTSSLDWQVPTLWANGSLKLRHELESAVGVTIIDPVWGRSTDRFWEVLAAALRGTHKPDRSQIDS